MLIKWQTVAILLLVVFLLGIFLSRKTSSILNEHSVHEKTILRTRVDTAYSTVIVPLAPIMATGHANRVLTHTVHDTLYRIPCLDTILVTDTAATAPDTLSVCYNRESNSFAARLWLSPRRKEVTIPYLAHDTFYWREDSVRTTSNTSRKWYEDVLTVIVSIVAGIVVGRL